MKLPRRNFLHLAASAAALPVVSRIASALAQTYPSRPITVIVGFPPGVGTDAVSRTIAEHMKTSLGQPIVFVSASRRSRSKDGFASGFVV